ncbi:MAG: NAD(P)/FAD-dependent oxidoreductase, partial [Candidatus Limnocylindria bacterium]
RRARAGRGRRRRAPLSPRRVVVVGGGFAGLHLIRRLDGRLRRGEAEITLVDRNNYHLFTPLLYQVATGELPAHAVAYPLRRVAARAGFQFRQSEVEAIDVEARLVRTADGPLPYDHVVVAPGSVTNDYGIAGVREHALAVKSLADAHAVRRRILAAFERAAIEGDLAKRRALLAFVLIGAGPVGVELASSMRDLMDHTLRPMYPQLDFARDITIVLMDGADRVLPQMDERLARIALRRLEQQRVRVVLRAPVSEVGRGAVRTRDGARFDGATIVWAGGVKVSPLVAALPLPRAKDGRLAVDATFRVGGRDDVLCFGDAASFEHRGGPLPQLAQVAVLQAPTVARNLARLVRGEPLAAYHHRPKGDLVALGRTNAGAQMRQLFGIPVGDIVIAGLPAWTVWRANYLMQLLGVRNRATLLMEWTLSYFFSRMVADTP